MDIVQNAVLTIHFPENAALQKMRGNSLHPPPPVETPAGVDRKCREIIHASAPSCLQLCARLWPESALGQVAGAPSAVHGFFVPITRRRASRGHACAFQASRGRAARASAAWAG